MAATSEQRGGFVHLHLHSEYSLLDGGNRLDKLVSRVKQLGMDAVAVTDHGNIFGAVSFYEKAREKGIKPILGVEAYVAPGSRRDRTYTGSGDGGFHLVLLAENKAGWENLLVLCSEAYLTGFYYKPRIDRELLAHHSEGLIAINGHLGSEIGDHLLDLHRSGDRKYWEKAVESASWHASVFTPTARGPRFYIELQRHVREQNAINPLLVELAHELNLPLVCDNDSHFLRQEDHDAHDTLICISTGKLKTDTDRLKYPPELYVKSPAEMRALCEGDGPEMRETWDRACDATVDIASRCNVELPIGANHAPMVKVKTKGDLPRHDDPRFAGDLSAWYSAYCACFEAVPFSIPADANDSERKEMLAGAKTECDRALLLLAEAGFTWRYGPDAAKELTKRRNDAAPESATPADDRPEKRARLDRELMILANKNISAYFLIVWDFVNWGRQRGIPSIARGSGVGTMVGFVLGLSNACPVRYGLLFERFTDPDRSEYPDIDIDLCQDGRADVINYVRAKYGHVAQIITFGTMKARAAIRDVGRVLGMSLPDVDKVAKLIPEQLGMTLEDALLEEPDLKKLYDADDRVRKLIDTARTLEGQARHAGVHAAGVIVATRPLHQIVPLYKQTGAAEHEIVTQWDGPTCEKMGLLKMDFLGLRTISIVERAKKLIRESLSEEEIRAAVGRGEERESRHGDAETRRRGDSSEVAFSASPSPRVSPSASHPMDLDRLAYDDQRVFALFRRGDTTGVFQFESGGMRRLLVEMKPDRLEDLIAANALFRPGPMDLIPAYNRRKHGTEAPPRIHEIVDRYTAETYGVMVYQEQVMQIVHGLGGITLRDAYTLIKNISKKRHDKIDKERPKFIDGAQRQGLDRKSAEALFELILKFAGYGFNKSHSTGYAIVAYQTAYLKTYFPNQYMAAFLTYESQANKVSEWTPYLEDCRRTRFTGGKVGVEVKPPDINLSQADFTVVFEEAESRSAQHGHVRFGLKAIKGAGDKAIEAIVMERDRGTEARKGEARRPYTSLHDFCERMPQGVVNKATVESLILCGAFDSVHGRGARASLIASLEGAISAAQRTQSDRASGQTALFGFGGGGGGKLVAETAALTKVPAWNEAETLKQEKEVLGFFVSSHPLESWSAWSGVFATHDAAGLKDAPQDQRVVVPAMVQSVRSLVVKSGRSAGQKMAILTAEDSTGQFEAVLFTEAYAKFNHLAQTDCVVFVLGRVDLSRGDPQVIVDRLVPIEGVPLMPGRIRITLDEVKLNGGGLAALERVAQVVRSANGNTESSGGATPKKSGEIPRFPVELEIATLSQSALLAADPKLRVNLAPDVVRELTGALGSRAVRIVGGVAVEMDQRNGQKRWVKRSDDE